MQNADKVYRILRPLIDELRSLIAGKGGGGLIATYYADNGATDVVLPNLLPATIAQIPGVVVGEGQKVIVHATAWATNNTDAPFIADIQIEQQTGIAKGAIVDEAKATLPSEGGPGSDATITRTFELTPLPGTYTYTMLGSSTSGGGNVSVLGTGSTPSFTPGGRLTIEVVSV